MGSTIQEYLASLRGKRVAVLGIGVSNTPLIKMLLRADVGVTDWDKRQRTSAARRRSWRAWGLSCAWARTIWTGWTTM